jgi:sporulation protein YlmC with PRC-barrel domain
MRACFVALGLVLAAPALADCPDSLGKLEKRIAEDRDMQWVLRSGLAPEVRQLRDTAHVLSRRGQNDACEEVVEAIDEILKDARKSVKAETRERDYEAWSRREAERVRGAVPVAELRGPVRMEDVLGADVRNLANEKLGEIEDVLVDKERGGISHVIVSRGGFLGLGEKQHAIPWSSLRATAERDVFVLDLTEDALKNAPSFKRGEWKSLQDRNWIVENDRYYDRARG